MSNKKTYIEINGTRHEVHKGNLLDLAPPALYAAPETTLPTRSSIDGVAPRSSSLTPDQFKPITMSTKISVRAQPKHAINHPQKSKILMRPAVKKPTLSVAQPTKKPAKPVIAVTHSAREARAQTIVKSTSISRFHRSSHSIELAHKDPVQAPTNPESTSWAQRVEDHYPVLSQLDKRLEQAIADASSHLQQLPSRKKRLRPAHFAASTCAVLLLAGFFAFQNVPNLQMRLAASKAGFSAQLPDYQPAGFSVNGPIQTEPGRVVVNFKSSTDNRFFSVKQQASEWNSSALLSNHIKNDKTNLRTFETEGKTIYVYGESNASWVSGGVWYEIAGDARLSEDQLQRIASSL